jgi:hydrogenase expression/formation protein HypD
MKYLDEFSNPDLARKLLDQIHAVTTKPWSMMEVCGGQTHSIIRHGIDQLLPEGVEMIHGPGCPVCVTPLEVIDKALAIAASCKGGACYVIEVCTGCSWNHVCEAFMARSAG